MGFGTIAVFIFEFLGIIAKNPIAQKVLMFSFFFGLVTFMVDFFVGKVDTSLLNSSTILSLASYLGFLNALKIVFNFLITGFIIKQILAYIR